MARDDVKIFYWAGVLTGVLATHLVWVCMSLLFASTGCAHRPEPESAPAPAIERPAGEPGAPAPWRYEPAPESRDY